MVNIAKLFESKILSDQEQVSLLVELLKIYKIKMNDNFPVIRGPKEKIMLL
ncbi:MAG: hypothetical protein ACFFD2_04565 [Promethearchaeota archaeon]